jgi:signal transduction histidine kinase/CheY-like chemotaxis protein
VSNNPLLPAIRDVLAAIRERKRVDEVLELVLTRACELSGAVHGSFVLVDHNTKKLSIITTVGNDWTLEKQFCQLKIGEGLTGQCAASAKPVLCADTAKDPNYYSLFDYVRSELVVPVIVEDQIWGIINLDGMTPNAFDDVALSTLTVFAELAAFAITLRLELNEQERLQRNLVQSEKLASLGEIIAGIAHEINNPLTSILGHASLLTLQRGGAADEASVQAIMSESQRAADLVKGLLDFSRKETGKRQLIGVNDLTKKVIDFKRYQLKVNNIHLTVETSPVSYPVLVSPQQIQQVLLALLNNAEHSIPRTRTNGRITLSVRRQGEKIQILVSDNGMGIPEALQKSIFDPFFTTKKPGEGTGLGLSIAHTIMESHGGTIELTSSSPSGTTFTLELPLSSQLGEEVDKYKTGGLPNVTTDNLTDKPRGRVLVVDDEPHILESLTTYLRLNKIEVESASDAGSALDILKIHNFDLVVSDIRMPGIDGLEFYQRAKNLKPHYERKFIFMSGFLMREGAKSQIDSTGCTFLQKPFPLDALRDKVITHLPNN